MPVSTPDRIASMKALFEPRSVCIIGASETNSYAKSAFCWLSDAEDRVSIHLVNPRRDEVYGRPCLPSISSVEESVDLAIVAVGTARVVEVLRECEARGVRAAIVVAAGFSENGSNGLARLEEFVRGSGMLVVGPSCLGVVNAKSGIAPYSGTYQQMPMPGPIAVASQSGGGVRAIFQGGTARGLGFSYLVSSGSEIDLETVDCLRYFAEDESTKVVCLLIEEARSPREFYDAVRACLDRGMVVIALKLGRSDAASRMAAAHTGAFTGSDRFWDLLFARLGVVRVASIEEMLDAASLAAQLPRELWPRGRSIGVVSITGGAAGAIADQLDEIGFAVPDLTRPSREVLARRLPGGHHIQNPLELSNQTQVDDASLWETVVDTFAADPGIAAVIVVELHASSQTAERVEAAARIQRRYRTPVLTASGSPWIEVVNGPMAARYRAHQLAHFVGPDNVVRALHALDTASAPRVWEPLIVDAVGADAVDAAGGVDDAQARGVLARFGLPVPAETVVNSPGQARDAAESMGGGPLVLKVVSDGIPHRAKLGLVATDVQGADEAASTVAALLGAAADKMPHAAVRGVAVQEQVSGFELFVGIDLQSGFAPILVLGRGGVTVEATPDIVTGLGGFTDDELRELLSRLRCYDWLRAEVGEKGIALAVRLIGDLLRVATENLRSVSHLEVNPLMVHASGDRAWCVDCLIVGKESAR